MEVFKTFGRESWSDLFWAVDLTVAPGGIPLRLPPELLWFLCSPRESLLSCSLVVVFLSHFYSLEFFTLIYHPYRQLFTATSAILCPATISLFIPFDLPFYLVFFWLLFAFSLSLPLAFSLLSPSSLSFHPHPRASIISLSSSLSSYQVWIHPIAPRLFFGSPSPEMRGALLWTVEQAFALWGFCLLCEVFSQIAAFHSPARHHTSLCACVCEHVWECSDAPEAREFVLSLCTFLTSYVHTHLYSCVFSCFLIKFRNVFTELSCLNLEWALCPGSIYQKPYS